MPIQIRIEQNGATPEQVRNRFNRIIDRLSKPDPRKAVQNVATIWAKSFRAEGAGVGGWASLAFQTQVDREARGYGREHPILQRRGSLYGMSTLWFMGGNVGSASATTNSSGKTVTTTASLSMWGGMAEMRVSGPLVKHQYGDPATNLPARPFWFTNKQVVLGARLGVIDWIKNEVVS